MDPSARHKEHEKHGHQGEAPADAGGGRAKWAFIAFALIAAFFLITEHRAHAFGILPYLLLLACPLMHLFHHGGHGGGHRGDHGEGKKGDRK